MLLVLNSAVHLLPSGEETTIRQLWSSGASLWWWPCTGAIKTQLPVDYFLFCRVYRSVLTFIFQCAHYTAREDTKRGPKHHTQLARGVMYSDLCWTPFWTDTGGERESEGKRRREGMSWCWQTGWHRPASIQLQTGQRKTIRKAVCCLRVWKRVTDVCRTKSTRVSRNVDLALDCIALTNRVHIISAQAMRSRGPGKR